MISDSKSFKRGTAWWANLPAAGDNVQRGMRTYLVVSSDEEGRRDDNIVEVVAMTASEKPPMAINVPFKYAGKTLTILCNQHFSVSTKMLGSYAYSVTDVVMKKVDTALKVAQGIDTRDAEATLILRGRINELEEKLEQEQADNSTMRVRLSKLLMNGAGINSENTAIHSNSTENSQDLIVENNRLKEKVNRVLDEIASVRQQMGTTVPLDKYKGVVEAMRDAKYKQGLEIDKNLELSSKLEKLEAELGVLQQEKEAREEKAKAKLSELEAQNVELLALNAELNEKIKSVLEALGTAVGVLNGEEPVKKSKGGRTLKSKAVVGKAETAKAEDEVKEKPVRKAVKKVKSVSKPALSAELIKALTSNKFARSKASVACGVSKTIVDAWLSGKEVPSEEDLNNLCTAFSLSSDKMSWGA